MENYYTSTTNYREFITAIIDGLDDATLQSTQVSQIRNSLLQLRIKPDFDLRRSLHRKSDCAAWVDNIPVLSDMEDVANILGRISKFTAANESEIRAEFLAFHVMQNQEAFMPEFFELSQNVLTKQATIQHAQYTLLLNSFNALELDDSIGNPIMDNQNARLTEIQTVIKDANKATNVFEIKDANKIALAYANEFTTEYVNKAIAKVTAA